VLTLTFENKNNEESKGSSSSAIGYSLEVYQASLRERLFEKVKQKFLDQGLLDKGKRLVLDSTIDIAMMTP
jgi:hypothetical protein